MTVVFKLGGSLLTLDRLAERLRPVLELRPAQRRLLVVGGGAAADVVREWSRIHQLTEETAHWLAISSLELNRQLLQELLSFKSVDSRSAADRIWETDLAPVFLEMTRFLTDEEASEINTLPHHWDVTSDSLAAWTALRWPAEELVLVKSVPVPGWTATKAVRSGLVDAYFPHISGSLPRISWCNLQEPAPSIKPWLLTPLET